jgi:TnsA endonuclease N terminal
MRKTKRFTEKTLERFKKDNRGTGIFEKYRGWHQVTRSDPSSRGLSHIQKINGRQIDLLSNGELVCVFFASMLYEVIDIREQFPLSLLVNTHELYQYDSTNCKDFPGTIDLAQELGLKHPLLRGGGKTVDWIMTTDLLLTLEVNGLKKLLAISVKPNANLSKRELELQSLERAYWEIRNVEWILITPEQYDQSVALRVRDSIPWVLNAKSSKEEIEEAYEIAFEMQGHPFKNVISTIAMKLGTYEVALRAFWQGVWVGKILLDLRRGWRPHEPIRLLSHQEFSDFNPLLARRTGWI